MRLSQAGVCFPHDLLEFPEFAKETRVLVVDLLSIGAKLGVFVRLDVPDTVGKSTATSTSNLLLLVTPVRKLDLVREESAPGHDVDKLELGLNSANALLGLVSVGQPRNDFDLEQIIGVTFKSFVTICRNLVLPISLGDWGANVMGVETAIRRYVVKLENSTILDPSSVQAIPGSGSRNRRVVVKDRLSLVLKKPDVILVLVGV